MPLPQPTKCCRCGTEEGPIQWGSNLCKKCGQANSEEIRKQQEHREEMQRRDAWAKVCAPVFRNTNPSHKGIDQLAAAEVAKWEPLEENGEATQAGLFLYGATGSGKTRLAMLALKRALDAGLQVAFVNSYDFMTKHLNASLMRINNPEIFERINRDLSSYQNSDVLLFDDLGKSVLTEKACAHFFALVDNRYRQCRPTIWTTNESHEDLERMFGENHGEPTLRRIFGASHLIEFKEQGPAAR